MILEISPSTWPILFAVVVIFVPVVVLAVFCFIRLIIKQSKKMRNAKIESIDYEPFFGGKANIKSIEVKMSRVNVTVNDIDKVDFESLKAHNIAALVVGNTLKCTSEELLKSVSK